MNNIEKCLDQFFVELQHTPGPWIFEDEYIRAHELDKEGVPAGDNRQVHDFGNIVADVYTRPSHIFEDEINANANLIQQSPSMIRELCRVYLIMLVKFGYGVNETVTSIRTTIWMQGMLSSLCGQISDATGLDAKHVHDTFEQYATWINVEE